MPSATSGPNSVRLASDARRAGLGSAGVARLTDETLIVGDDTLTGGSLRVIAPLQARALAISTVVVMTFVFIGASRPPLRCKSRLGVARGSISQDVFIQTYSSSIIRTYSGSFSATIRDLSRTSNSKDPDRTIRMTGSRWTSGRFFANAKCISLGAI